MIDGTLLLPNFNNEHVLPLAFDNLRRRVDCTRLKIIAVDDGSEDNGLRVLKREIPKCRFAASEIIERPHEGIVPTLNAGLRAAETDLVFRIDGDALVITDNWVQRMKQFLSQPQIGLVGGQTIFDSGLVHGLGRSVISESGLHDIGTFIIEPAGRRTLDSNVWRPFRTFDRGNPCEVDTILATCVGFRREDAIAIGGFDQRFNPVWIEDDDFGIALRAAGRKVVMDPSIHVLHKVSIRGSRAPGVQKQQRLSGPSEDALSVFKSWLLKYTTHTLAQRQVNFSPAKGKFFVGQKDWRSSVLTNHYSAWRDKWKFDPLNPDLEGVLERYYETEICWKYNRELFLKGCRAIRKAVESPGQ